MESMKLRQLFLLLLFMTVPFVIIYYVNLCNYFRVSELKVYKNESKVKHILFWTKAWDNEDFYLGLGSEPFKRCPINNCFTTSDKKFMPVEDFDAVLFHGAEYTLEKYGKPQKRKHNQVYVSTNRESPINTVDDDFKNFFNWTMTYRRDSDIIYSYGSFIKMSNTYRMPKADDVTQKSKKIAWFVSHCNVQSKRDDLAKEMQKYMEIDIFGSCGNLICPKELSEECYNKIDKEYKFYLSFENSFCKDYVTEKLYNILAKNIIPIVYGNNNYSEVAPPHSVIDVRNFKNVSSLMEYVKYLDENVDEYLKYFEWKKSFILNRQSPVCELCKKLNEPINQKVYSDLKLWWHGDKNNKICEQLPEIVRFLKN
ncbi:alpha-(1,3)-fucosyltransferase C-like [Aethina tumida]|uniref:alpha-(1,3)-fucosyltransferase C-like n=1 Tax=Aethina tumida TaxID=116153 RepID=UPI0021484F80|nr:alpha-(1,3)-fucosyltransferase C-like [Aethina tumida]